MAVTGSGLFCASWINILTQSSSGAEMSLDAETHKVAMYDNTITPDFDAAAASAAYNAGAFASGQVSGTGYTAGGATLTGTTVTSATGVITFDASDVSWASSSITSARCALIYADGETTPVADPALCLVNFGADYTTSNGTFTIQWSASGVFTWDLVP